MVRLGLFRAFKLSRGNGMRVPGPLTLLMVFFWSKVLMSNNALVLRIGQLAVSLSSSCVRSKTS